MKILTKKGKGLKMSIDEIKNLQQKIIRKNKLCNLVGIIIIAILAVLSIFALLDGRLNMQTFFMALFFQYVICTLILLIVKAIINDKDSYKFSEQFKNYFVLSALKKSFDNLVYKPDEGFEEEKIASYKMINMGDRHSSNDYISGKYKNINFEQADIHIEEEHESRDSDGNKTTTWVTIFQGRWMIFDFNKRFRAKIQIISPKFRVASRSFGTELSTVQMEDMEFNKMFKIYSENEHDAFYILTPHFMEKIKKIFKELNTPMMFCFMDNKLHIAIDNRQDSFEYNVLKPIDEEEVNNSIMKDIKLITDFVNELNLDNDLFKEVK